MKRLKKIGLTAVVLVTSFILTYYSKLEHLWLLFHLFSKDRIVRNFYNMDKIVLTREVRKPEMPYRFPNGKAMVLPGHFSWSGQRYVTNEFLKTTYTTGLLVLQEGRMVYEQYFLGHAENKRHISWSVSKSFVSALFGIAVNEGNIKSIDQKVEEYVPELIGSGYEGVTIRDVLQMSTGVRFNEDYSDYKSDINRWARSFAWGSSQDEFAATLKKERAPGTFHNYVSINTHVLGMILVRATGSSLSAYMEEKLWKKIGAEYDAFWVIDEHGMEMALGGLNASLRDYAKLGMLYLNGGNWEGEQVIPYDWVRASVTPGAPYLMPGHHALSTDIFGYGYHWWIPEGGEGEFLARGVYNQYIYVNPSTHTVVVKNSANYRYNKNTSHPKHVVHLELLRAIAHAAGRTT